MRVLAALLLAGTLTSAAAAQDYDVDGVLEEGDQVNDGRGYVDAYGFEANAGDEARFSITGMDGIVPHAAIIDSTGTPIYTTFGVTGELTVNWKFKDSGAYQFLVTQEYKSPTPYHLKIAELPQGTIKN